jgi:hypothetical protein
MVNKKVEYLIADFFVDSRRVRRDKVQFVS